MFQFAVGLMAQNEAAWLRLHLPVVTQAAIDGLIVVDGGSTDDTAAAAESFGATVVRRAWDWRPCDQENAVIEAAERAGYDALLLTAPDELLWPHHIDMIRFYLETGQARAVGFPTFNFVRDRRHYAPDKPYYPDWHTRAWVLGQGVRHVGAIDSVPNIPGEDTAFLPHVHLYHYSHIKDRRFYAWKGVNFNRVKDGLPPLDTPWEWCDPAPYPRHIPFDGSQPLDPAVIGDCAPLE